MGDKNRAILVVFAHPDDDELACFGTLARLHKEGYRVCVLELTAGECSVARESSLRTRETISASELIGYRLITENLPDGEILYDIDLVSLIEKHMRQLLPRVVITHYPQVLGTGHQDHVAVASAVVNAARRSSFVEWILYAEPPVQAWDFAPNLFVDITDYLNLKKEAVCLHQSEQWKAYMQPEIIEMRARWWALQAYPSEASHHRFYEAFMIVKGILRGGNSL